MLSNHFPWHFEYVPFMRRAAYTTHLEITPKCIHMQKSSIQVQRTEVKSTDRRRRRRHQLLLNY